MQQQTGITAVLVGSLRKDSINRKVAQALIARAPSQLRCEIVEIGGLEMYNQDSDGNPPASYVAFRQRISSAGSILFVTPEYNRSVPAVLKNALDVASRPYGQSVWDGKPAAVVSATPGSTGAFGANHHLRQCLVFLNVPVMQQPEAYISGADKLFEGDGHVTSEKTDAFLKKFMQAFSDWVTRIRGG